MQKRIYYAALIIFSLSGFSGLIYESIWTDYLKLFLGHSAYAQSLVLVIFMGGMALGSWVCGRYSSRWTNLLAGYALAEFLVGVFALGFHTFFDRTVLLSHDSIIPHLNSPAAAVIFKWTLSALMIMPQSVLLGMTFPLMTAGIIRLRPESPGSTISLLYFANSIGAAAGVLASGFILIRLLGLPWTIRTAGFINIALALSVLLLARGQSAVARGAEAEQKPTEREKTVKRGFFLFLFASFLTGAASFIYEIGWIRMLNLVLGSSTHAFELMLSAFILGLAFGGLWIQRRIDRLLIPERYLAGVQVVMGLLALSTLPLYGQTFSVMQWLVNALNRTDSGYILFNLSSNALALAVMLPPTFCAGMTLPLITLILIKRGLGERSIGAAYAANTVGAIVGVFFAIHLGMPLLGLKGLVATGVSLDIALGLLLFWTSAQYSSRRLPLLISGASLCAVGAVLLFVNLDVYGMISGVYRTGKLFVPGATELKYYRDGKTATISTFRDKYTDVLCIATNGKPDASLRLSMSSLPTVDEPTMVLLAVMPMAFHPQARSVANIGLGSGLTTHVALQNPWIEQVDTVEIEESVVEAAAYFRPRVDLVFTDPRSNILIADAKTFFSAYNKKYDIIISEPSNPWVSGVAGLFSEEFYRLLNRHLNPDGVFAQWVQLYDINTDLVLSILKAVSLHFSDYAVYAANDGDMIIVAKKQGSLAAPDSRILKIPGISKLLQRVYIYGMQDIEIRKIGDKNLFSKLIRASEIRANSDYFPVVDQNIARTSFQRSDATDFRAFSHDFLPARDVLARMEPSRQRTAVTLSPFLSESEEANTAMALRDYVLYGKFGAGFGEVPPGIQQEAVRLTGIFYDCRSPQDEIGRRVVFFNSAVAMIPYLTPQELGAVWKKLESGPCAGSLSPGERNWMALFKAVGRRDPKAMVSASTTILESEERIPPNALKFFVASGMLGCLKQGDRDGAHRLWSLYRSALFNGVRPDLLFRLLAAESTISD